MADPKTARRPTNAESEWSDHMDYARFMPCNGPPDSRAWEDCREKEHVKDDPTITIDK